MAFYRTKHPIIAKVIREYVVKTPLPLLQAVVEHVQRGDKDEHFLVRDIVKNDEQMRTALPELALRRQLFNSAIARLPDDIVIRHQSGIDEMQEGNLEEARRIFDTCLEMEQQTS